ncbi:MAG: anaerobic ribonucleoside-triphosphate reductase activating protein [Lachnospiraceae bacterium]|nr:anaerobic ribonucleoside-triphosphate reductase activating protein [Lachnospiraceae bacterium]
MNYASIKIMDVANGPGVRMSLFVSGCTHYCKGCFNQEAWDFNYGEPFTQKEIDYIIDYVSGQYVAGLTILGGEPMEHVNQQGLLPLLRQLRAKCPDKSIWCFTGYDFEKDVVGRMMNEYEETKELLSYIDVMVDGKFVEELKDLSIRFRGSSNQRIIMVQESLKTGEVVLWDETSQR